MEIWPLLLLTFSLFLSAAIFSFFSPSKNPRLPPGPPSIPVVGNLLWLRRFPSLSNIETVLRNLRARHGGIITLRFGSRPSIFITDRALAHKALVELGASFADRPPPAPSSRFLNTGGFSNISSAPYGPLWRLLRRNLSSEILHPAKVCLFSYGRRWVLSLLLRDLQTKSLESPDSAVVVMESFKFAIFALLVLMCFGEKLDEKAIREIEAAQTALLLYASKYLRVFIFFPGFLTKFLFRNRLRTILQMRRRQTELFLPLIRARMEHRSRQQSGEERIVYSYVDSLLDINLAMEGGRLLTDDEMVALCSEFLFAGTNTTATVLEWTIAEIVAQRAVQAKLVEEVKGVANGEVIKEEDLQQMPYLKAVVLEGLRRHPPVHFVLPHSVKEDTEFEGYFIPKNITVSFVVSDLGWDEKVWEKPMEFRPERFMAGGDGEGVDISGSREIKMMPFGAGRRICPGIGLSMLHLEYFLANLVREFEWEAMDDEEINFLEKSDQFTVVMKKPLRARITTRRKA